MKRNANPVAFRVRYVFVQETIGERTLYEFAASRAQNLIIPDSETTRIALGSLSVTPFGCPLVSASPLGAPQPRFDFYSIGASR